MNDEVLEIVHRHWNAFVDEAGKRPWSEYAFALMALQELVDDEQTWAKEGEPFEKQGQSHPAEEAAATPDHSVPGLRPIPHRES